MYRRWEITRFKGDGKYWVWYTWKGEFDDNECGVKYKSEQKQLTLAPTELHDKVWIDKNPGGQRSWIQERNWWGEHGLVMFRLQNRQTYCKRKVFTSIWMIGSIPSIQRMWVSKIVGWNMKSIPVILRKQDSKETLEEMSHV